MVDAGAILVVDEAFADFVPGISVTDMVDRRLWVARSFTKFFAIPGLRLGCLVCDDAGRVQALQPSWPVNAVAAAAGIAAVEDRGFAEASIAEVARLREDLFGALDALPGDILSPVLRTSCSSAGPMDSQSGSPGEECSCGVVGLSMGSGPSSSASRSGVWRRTGGSSRRSRRSCRRSRPHPGRRPQREERFRRAAGILTEASVSSTWLPPSTMGTRTCSGA